jgi:hypothetical protein
MNYTDLPQSCFDADRKQKLEIAQSCALHGERGHVFFFQFSQLTLVSMCLTSGKLKEGSTSEHEVHVHYIQEHTGYPDAPNLFEKVIDKGYVLYKTYMESIGKQVMTATSYSSRFKNIARLIEDSISANHGIVMYENGDIYNYHPSNKYYLHKIEFVILFNTNCIAQPTQNTRFLSLEKNLSYALFVAVEK